MAAPVYLAEGVQVRGGDPYYTEVISKRMRVPERLRVGQGGPAEETRPENLHAVYSMHVPDRLALTDAPDLSPRPLFSKQSATSMWDLQHGAWDKEAHMRESIQSPLRRSYSDQTFGRTPPGTPTHSKQALHSPSVSRSAGRAPPVGPDPPLPEPLQFSNLPPSLLSPQSMLQAARQLGQRASKKLLQTVTQKYSTRFGFPENPPPQPVEVHIDQTRKSTMQESWLSPEEENGTAVEFIVLRRQVLKMSRRIAGLERQNAERKQNELVLLTLLLSACLLNGWLWMRR
ncbi:mitochondrial fission factor-like isoform X1 [Astyanax mexicanus]|uniref:mitochondrial fission factor-like isoform X1 n=1 Tax=Astyanax mexicanus TaxID=7994 RepID=UPI0020CAC571|nr:mitochondrial fission factor-like isoform X1 [Astyanax mexicanus]XP_007244515.3 mitochondrial fission factor-like isoform X1 [Astyanax mexicanus]